MKTEKNRIARKLYEWMWFIITLYPFFVCFFTAFNDAFFTQQSLESALSVYASSLDNFFYQFTETFIGDSINYILQLTDSSGNPMFVPNDTIVHFGVYLITVEIVRLVVDLLLWIPRFLQKQLNKGVK